MISFLVSQWLVTTKYIPATPKTFPINSDEKQFGEQHVHDLDVQLDKQKTNNNNDCLLTTANNIKLSANKYASHNEYNHANRTHHFSFSHVAVSYRLDPAAEEHLSPKRQFLYGAMMVLQSRDCRWCKLDQRCQSSVKYGASQFNSVKLWNFGILSTCYLH